VAPQINRLVSEKSM